MLHCWQLSLEALLIVFVADAVMQAKESPYCKMLIRHMYTIFHVDALGPGAHGQANYHLSIPDLRGSFLIRQKNAAPCSHD